MIPIIIVEGPDGSGKDTLIRELLSEYRTDLVLGPRAVKSSVGGPVDNLGEWMIKDFREWQYSEACRLYNRYPLISEPIYGPLLRGHYQEGFMEVEHSLRSAVAHASLVIMCLPPLSVVKANVSKARDMAGVEENIKAIHELYFRTAKGWPGHLITYDYTGPNQKRAVHLAVLSHLRKRLK